MERKVCQVTLFVLLIMSALSVYVCLQVMYMYRKYKMHRKEVEYLESGSGPFGSGLCHGMVLDPEKDGVLKDSKKSSAWYSRLV